MTKGGTASTKKHKFESFNQRIAKLNIDPIRRPRGIRIDTEPYHLTDTASHLRAGLDHWKESNLSENFTSFTQDLQSLCDNLPQVLYYHEEIMLLLVTYIEEGNSLSLEPLLDLLARFAQDLNAKFEIHFSKAITLLASLVSKHVDVEIIDWSFTCLAWLFKYLSRLLVPNLRPLFHVMAPLLGREPQKSYITRFAAEAMSFLLRKVAVAYHKNKKPLINIIDCIVKEIEVTEQVTNVTQAYLDGIMTLLINSIKGIDRKIHSCGDSIYRCLLDRIAEGYPSKTEKLICGLTTSLIHHTDAAAFAAIINIILTDIKKQEKFASIDHVNMYCRLLFTVVVVRKATRIQDWPPIFDVLMILLKTSENSSHASVSRVFETAAVVLQSSPVAVVDLRSRPIMDFIADERNTEYFILFCRYFCDLDRERFDYILLPYFSKYVLQKIVH